MFKRAVKQFGRFGWVRPTVLLLMTCHLGRFYSDVPMALAICFEHNHRGVALTSAEEHHAHHHEPAAAGHHHNDDLAYKVEHCRDIYQGLNLIPSTVMAAPAEAFANMPAGYTRAALYAEPPRFTEPSASIFHPPQLLS